MAFDAEKENAKAQKEKEKQQKKADKEKANEIKEKAQATIDEAKDKVDSAEDALDDAKDAVKANEKRIKQLEDDIEDAEKERNEILSKQSDEFNRLENMMNHPELYSQAQIDAQRATYEAVTKQYNDKVAEIKNLQKEKETCEGKVEDLNKAVTTAQENLDAAKQNLERAEQNYKDIKDEIANGTLEEAESLAYKGEAACGTPRDEATSLAEGVCPKCGATLSKTDAQYDYSGVGVNKIPNWDSSGNVTYTTQTEPDLIRNAYYKCPQCGYEHDVPEETSEDENEDENAVPEYNPSDMTESEPDPVAPWDVRLYRSDLFLYGEDAVPFSSDEASGIMADLIEYQPGKDKKHAAPRNEKQYGIVSNDPNNYGLLSLVNPYSTTRLYNGLTVSLKGKYVDVTENRMLDIRDQKRFYDVKKINDNTDPLTVSNPTTSNIIQIMCNDKWGRTPYTYQDFVFCKYWNRIPNNRLITLRKYAAPTYDNLCWEMMGHDKNKMTTKFAPIATACTFFGGESGNSLKDLFKIQSGLNWEEIGAEIWNVTGDSGETQQEVAERNLASGGTNGMASTGSSVINSMFNFQGKMLAAGGSLLKFLGAAKSPNVFSGSEANAQKFYENLHDPNDQGPYANRIKGPLNRIDKVMKRKEGIKFDHKITLKFSYKARPIGGVNTKAAMLDIMSNMLLMCSASAVFWGGGHRFMITPHAYPWHVPGGDGFLKAVYNGQIFGKNGAIAHVLKGVADVGSSGDGSAFSLENVTNFLGKIGGGVLGAFGGAINALVGTLQGAGLSTISQYVQKGQEWLNNKFGNTNGFSTGNNIVNNLIKNTQDVWKSNSVKETVLPYVEGMRALLLGTPVGNWHLTVGNPLNPIAVIGNLICEDISFEFGEELGPDDFPDELDCTVTLSHGMPRDLAGIESMFNRGAGRIYQAPDYLKMWGSLPSSDQETKVDALTGGTSMRVPHKFVAVEGKAKAGKYYSISDGKKLTNTGSTDANMSAENTIVHQNEVLDYNRGYNVTYSRTAATTVRAAITGNIHTRHYTDS